MVKYDLCILIPTFHEEKNIKSLFKEFNKLKSNLKLFPLSDPAKLFYSLDENSFFYRRYKVLTRLLPFYNKNNNDQN